MPNSKWIRLDVDRLRDTTVKGESSAMLNDVPTELQVQVSNYTASLVFRYVVNDEPRHVMHAGKTSAHLGLHSKRLYALDVQFDGKLENVAAALSEGMKVFIDNFFERDGYERRGDNFKMAKAASKGRQAGEALAALAQ